MRLSTYYTSATHSGTAFDYRLQAFPEITSYGSNSDGDVAYFSNSAIKDEFFGYGHKSIMEDRMTGGSVYSITARGFSESHVGLNSGSSTHQDIAKLYDTTGTERLYAYHDGSDVPHVSMYTDTGALDLLYEVIGWETTSARGYYSTTNTTNITGSVPSLELRFWWDGYYYG